MKIATWNVNGIRACVKKGFLQWLASEDPDIVCLQETKAQKEQLDQETLAPYNYSSYWHSAEKKGYSGVAIYSKEKPLFIHEGLGIEQFDREGRVLTAEFNSFFLVTAYFPNSQRDHARLNYKLSFCEHIHNHLNNLRESGKEVLVCGDFNIAHNEIDLKNPKTNRDNAGFLPEERNWMGLFLKDNYVDIFRHFVKEPDHYTWWSYRPGVRERNIGWRLDYFCSSQGFIKNIKNIEHQPSVMGSDHCPVMLHLKG